MTKSALKSSRAAADALFLVGRPLGGLTAIAARSFPAPMLARSEPQAAL
jgi:hypothetical protein